MIYYDGSHTITIGDKNTWTDWKLIPTSVPFVNPPEVKYNIIDIPGSDGVLDLTDALANRPLYKNRQGSWDFLVADETKPWSYIYSNIMSQIQGRKFRIILSDDPTYYYEGRVSVNAWKSNKDLALITIDYDLHPFKMEIDTSATEWIWDTFNFETGVIKYYKNIKVTGSLEVRVLGSLLPSVVTISSSSTSMRVRFKDVEYRLLQGQNVISDIVIVDGINILTFIGTGIVSITYSGGML